MAKSFEEALEILGIEDYGERIFHSNSHGELFYLLDYITLANCIEDATLFREWFEDVVRFAEENWERPESIFQHILFVFKDYIEQIHNKANERR